MGLTLWQLGRPQTSELPTCAARLSSGRKNDGFHFTSTFCVLYQFCLVTNSNPEPQREGNSGKDSSRSPRLLMRNWGEGQCAVSPTCHMGASPHH